MVNVKKTEQKITELEKQIRQLKAQKEKEAEKAAALKGIVKDVKAQLRANKLSVDDLLEALGGSAGGAAKAPAKKGRKKAAGRKKKATGTRITIPDLGTYTVSSRGRLPAELADFVKKSGLSRAELVEKFKKK